MEDWNRFRAWMLAVAVAILGSQALYISGTVDLGESIYLTANLGWAGAILGGTSLTGGVGRVGGIFAAVLVIAIIETLMNLYGVAPSIRQIVFGLILLGAIYLASLQGRLRLRPEGR